ncbi:MAG: adenine phosphoribosyltransferase [Alphaproteobacteria bacterium]|nr:adenine phosphoribosyltransferase [Alphaproteobacteria bacterium]
MNLQNLKKHIRNVPDFPEPGIQFKDITPILQNAEVFQDLMQTFYEHYKNAHIDYVVGIEARGFIFGAVLASMLKCGFIPIRKPGKLPAETIAQEYELEYGNNKLEIHKDALKKGDRVVIFDDLIAIGGTSRAAADLVRKLGAEIVEFAFIIELSELKGREKLKDIAEVYSLVQY